ncbi:MGMT family protein [Streptomyces sp. NPDC055722]
MTTWWLVEYLYEDSGDERSCAPGASARPPRRHWRWRPPATSTARRPRRNSKSRVAVATSSRRRGPVPLVVPCHRVVRSFGPLGQDAGGADVKRYLLDMKSPA